MAGAIEAIRNSAYQAWQTEKSEVVDHMHSLWEREKPGVITKFWDVIEERVNTNITDQIHPKYQEGALAAYDTAISEGYVPFFVTAPHTAHFDGVPLALVTEYLVARANGLLPPERKIKGVKLPIASTLLMGEQGLFLREGFKRLSKPVTQRGIEFIEYVRKKEANDQRPENRYGLMDAVGKAVDNDYAPALLPEGSVQAGRRRENARHWYDINGMQPFQKGAIHLFILQMRKHGKRALIIPVAPFGSHRVQDVDNYRIAPKGVVTLFSPVPMTLIEVRVGMPIRSDTLYEELAVNGKVSAQTVDEYIGSTLARITPPRGRGIWRNKV